MKRIFSVVLAAAFLVGFSANAYADHHNEKKMDGGLKIMLLPVGSMTVSAGPISASADLGFGFGVGPFFDYKLHKFFAVGFGPEFIFGVKGKGSSGDASKVINLNARLKGLYPIMDMLEAYVLVTPGFSLVLPPAGDSPKGFQLGFAGGANYMFTQMLGAFMEIGYMLGFQSVNSADSKVNYFQINLGANARF